MSRRPRTDDALADALAVWFETRAASVADAVEALAAVQPWTPASVRIGPGFEAAWRAAIRDPVGCSWAAPLLFERLVGHNDAVRSEALVARLKVIDEMTPDPRVSIALANQIGSPLLKFSAAASVAELVLFLGIDERVRTGLATSSHPIARRVMKARFDYPAPTRRELERFAVAARPAAMASPEAEALLRAAIEHPDDDATRSVLADTLQATGDLRGELMALQLANRGHARVEEILRACARDWLGPLREVAYRVEYRRGILARFELDHSWCAKQRSWDEHARDPLLATVEELVPGSRASGVAYQAFLRSPVLTKLRSVEVFDRDSALALGGIAMPIEHVECSAWRRGRTAAPFKAHVLPFCERMPSLRSLGISIEALEMVASSPLRDQLKRLVITADQKWQVGLARLQKLAVDELVLVDPGGLPACTATLRGWQLHLVRGRTPTARGPVAIPVIKVLAELGEKRLELEIGEVPAGIANAAKANRIELVQLDPVRRSGFASKLHD